VFLALLVCVVLAPSPRLRLRGPKPTSDGVLRDDASLRMMSIWRCQLGQPAARTHAAVARDADSRAGRANVESDDRGHGERVMLDDLRAPGQLSRPKRVSQRPRDIERPRLQGAFELPLAPASPRERCERGAGRGREATGLRSPRCRERARSTSRDSPQVVAETSALTVKAAAVKRGRRALFASERELCLRARERRSRAQPVADQRESSLA